MLSGHFFLAVILITIVVTIIQWFFTGFLFHKYQNLTPAVWRKESSRSYAASTLLALFFAFMFTIIFSLWKNKYGATDIMNGIEFGLICWLTFSIPFEIGNAIYISYSRVFVAGKCVSSLFEFVAAGIIAAGML